MTLIESFYAQRVGGEPDLAAKGVQFANQLDIHPRFRDKELMREWLPAAPAGNALAAIVPGNAEPHRAAIR